MGVASIHVSAAGKKTERYYMEPAQLGYALADAIHREGLDVLVMLWADGSRTMYAAVENAAEATGRLSRWTPNLDRQCGECGGLSEVRHAEWCNRGQREDAEHLLSVQADAEEAARAEGGPF